ncbi:MAG: T9SS type A sorting domain-containing protein [Rhodothermaceae bacterium]|nr:T9SS type A sorting domain-containing protein [Rhodothermaceae bacterium]
MQSRHEPKLLVVFGCSYLLCAMLVCQPASAADPDVTQWSLPKDAIARLGKGNITAVAYSPDNTRFAVGGSYGTWLYDARTGEALKVFPNQSDYHIGAGDLAFSSDGRTLAVGLLWGIDLWDVTTGTYMKTLEAPDSGSVLSLAFLPVSFELASGHSDGTVKVWDTLTGEIYKTFTIKSDPTTEFLLDVSYVFQGQYLTATQRDGTVNLWYTKPQTVITTKEDGTEVHRSTDPYEPVGTYSVLPATVFPEPELPDRNSNIPPEVYEARLEQYRTLNQRYYDLRGDAEGGELYVLPENPIGVYIKRPTNSLVFFDVDTITRIRKVPDFYFFDFIYTEYNDDLYGIRTMGDVAMRYLPDEGILLVWSAQGSAVFGVNLSTNEWTRLADLAPDGFSVHSFFSYIHLETGPPEGRLSVYPPGIVGDAPSNWYVIDGSIGEGGTTVSILDNSPDMGDIYHTSFEFSPNLTTIVGWYDDYWNVSDGWLWNVATGKNIAALKAHTIDVNGVAFSPDGALVAVASGGRIFLWDIATRENIEILEHTFWVDSREHVTVGGAFNKISISFSPDGQTLASAGGSPDYVFVWDVATGKKIAAYPMETYKSGASVISISYSPDGEHFVTGATDGKVVLWDADTGTRIRTIEAHAGPVQSISWSKDGSFFVTAGGYVPATVRRWNNDGEPAAAPNMLELEEFLIVENVSYSPCGTEVAVGTNSTILIWEIGTTDVNQDGTTDMKDVQLVSEHLRENTLGGDVNADGEVDIVDLVVTMKQRDVKDEKTEIAENVKVLPVEEWWDHNHIIAYAPDGQTIASIGAAGQPVVWDVATGIRLKTLGDYGHNGHGQYLGATSIISYSPDGTILATGSADGTVHLWDVSQKLVPKGPYNFLDVSYLPDTPTVQYYPAAKASEPIGTEFTVTLRITDALPSTITGYEIDLQFDNKVLRYVESMNGDYLPEETFVVPTIVNGNQLKLAAASGAGVNQSSGILASVTFEVVCEEPAPLKVSSVRLTQGICVVYPAVKQIELHNPDAAVPPRIKGDVNRDGTVNIQDIVKVAASFGSTGVNPADVNCDGEVNIQDLVQVASLIGNAAAAPVLATLHHTDQLTREEVQHWLTQTQQLDRTYPNVQRSIRFLEQLLLALTPKETALLPNYPNPFNPETWIPYQLSAPGEVKIEIHAVDGSLVRTLSLGHQATGSYQSRTRAAYWDGRNSIGEPVASGVYFYTLTAGDFTATRKMLIRK